MYTDDEIKRMAKFSKNSKIIRKFLFNTIRWKNRLSIYPIEWKNSRKLYHYFFMENSIAEPTCLECTHNVTFVSYIAGYKLFCSSKCCNSSTHWKNAVKKSNIKNYGVENVMQLPKIRKILKDSMLEKYGVDNYSKHSDFITKFQKTCLDRYGVLSPMQLDEFKEKQQETYFANYGVCSHNKVRSIKDKKKETWLKKYGFDNPSKVPIVKIKKHNTMLLNGYIKSDDEKSLQKSYYDKVTRYTTQSWLLYFYKINPHKLKRSFDEYHLDHIYSIIDGFKNGVDPKIIGHWTNLQMLPMIDNLTKQRRSDKSLDQLLEDYCSYNKPI